MSNKFGQLLRQKRNEASLMVSELAFISGLPEAQIEALERGSGELPNFDTCYRLCQAVSSRTGQAFLLSDLLQAVKVDKSERSFQTTAPLEQAKA